MIVRGFKPVAWVAAVGTAALGCYMLSLQVAAERAELAGLERRIVSTQQSIRSLQTELGTRGRLQQLEQWNAEVLALSAPAAGQFLESTVSLARFDAGRTPVPVEAPVRMASAEAAPGPAPAVVNPTLRLASATTSVAAPKPPAATPTAAPDDRPVVRQASLQVTAPAPASPPPARAAEPRRAASLLDDGTLRDLRREARTEQGGGTRN
jgi:hypothetical protein